MSIFLNELKRKGVQPTLESFFKTSARLHNIPGQLYGSRKWRTLTDLLANPWFERVWVVQEVVMAPDRSGCPEDPIVLAFENCTISFEMFATVVQKIWDDHLHTELAYNPKSKDTTDQLRQYPPVRISVSSLIPVQTLFRGNESPTCNVDYFGIFKPTTIQSLPEHRLSLYLYFSPMRYRDSEASC